MRGSNETLSIYVVDDDDAVRDSLAALLEPEGFIVHLFPSAEAFLPYTEQHYPDDGGRTCLLLDLHMAGGGGQKLFDIVRRHERPMPIVVMTGNNSERSRALALKSGAAAFLEKPVDADLLINTIRSALSR